MAIGGVEVGRIRGERSLTGSLVGCYVRTMTEAGGEKINKVRGRSSTESLVSCVSCSCRAPWLWVLRVSPALYSDDKLYNFYLWI